MQKDTKKWGNAKYVVAAPDGTETITESHGGPFSGSHARYICRSEVSRVEADREAA